MTLILFVVVLVMGIFLADIHGRLKRLERQLREEDGGYSAHVRYAEESVDKATHNRPSEELVSPPEAATQPVDESPMTLREAHLVRAFAAPDPVEVISGPAPDTAFSEAEQHEREAAALSPAAKPVLINFEDLFGRKLPIWAGGVTLLVAAVLLVKYSIDAGLLSPAVRVTLGLVFGAGLIGVAELARKMERLVQDERVAQALAGAGVGSLYAATLAANNLYHLVTPGTAFAGLCVITALAMGLALRFGAPCAVLALVGGLATPALVQTGSPNIPLLSGYLAMVIGSLTVLSRRQRWFWLGVMALTGGMGWTAIMILMGALSQMSVLTIGLLVIFLGLALPFLNASDARGTILRVAGAVAAALQLAVLVSVGGYDALSWGLYGLLSLAFLWLSGREPKLRPMMIVPMLVSLGLIWFWPQPSAPLFAAVTTGIVLIFGGSALWRLWREGGSISEAGQITAVAVGSYLISSWQFMDNDAYGDTARALVGVAFAMLPMLGVALGWRNEGRQRDARFPTLALASGFLLIGAGFMGLPEWMAPIVPAAVSAALLMVACLSGDRRVSHGGLVYLGFGLLVLLGTGAFNHELDRLGDAVAVKQPLQAVLRWATLALVWGAYGWRYTRSVTGMIVTAVAAGLAYGLAAQIVPEAWLAITAAAGILALTLIARRRLAAELMPAMITLALIMALWMLLPLGDWLLSGGLSLMGEPMLVTDLPSTSIVLRRLLVPALLGLASLWLLRGNLNATVGRVAAAAMAVPALIGLHCLYKLVFALDTMNRFAALGLAERTLWQALLIGAGVALWRLAKQREAALVLLAVGIAHNLFYSLILHNPLWSEQAVGAWPLVNLLLPAFGIAFAAPRLLRGLEPVLDRAIAPVTDIAHMLVMLVFAFASLRQLFIGSVFALAPVEQGESIFWSVLAIALAIGWLLWGIRQSARSWRIGSLALMLAAIAKVFLIDASGLEGLLRVASFLALGFSLIGIGWLYSRFLRADPV